MINFCCVCYIVVNEIFIVDGEKGLLVFVFSDLEIIIVNMNDVDDVFFEVNLLDV